MRKSRVLVVAMVAMATPSFAAAAQWIYVREPAVAAATMDAELDACVAQVLGAMNGPASPAPRLQNPTNDQVLAHAFDLRGQRLAAERERRCMADKGYVALALTSEETRAFRHARGLPGRDAWYDAFVAGDLSARIAVAKATAAGAS